jgi:tetratricopeptide (TPR) repeat protein
VRRLLGLLALALLAGACAKRVVPVVPEGEDYVQPTAAPGDVSATEAKELEAAWTQVRAGDTAAAARRYTKLLERRPTLAPAETGLAYARLRAGQLEAAAATFAAVLERQPEYLPALVGAGSVAFRRGDLAGALGVYRRAQAVAPEDPLVRKRLAALKLQAAERSLGLARAAAARGDTGEAERQYAAALEAAPEVAPVRLALAELLVARGDRPGAVALLEADPSGDRQAALRRAALLLEEQEFARAAEVYRGLLARDPRDEAARAGERAATEAQELASMPAEYRAIPEAPRVTRADLAALVAVRVHALRRVAPGEPVVALDIGSSWAREHVDRVLALGIMDVYPNHTFQPGAAVRRADVARVVGRTLDRLGWPRAAAPAPSDMSPSHLDFGAVERAVGAGLMELTPAGAFEPWRPVSGREAIAVVDALARLLGP